MTTQRGSDNHSTGSETESLSRSLLGETSSSVESHSIEPVSMDEQGEVAVVEYPAPIPVFSKQLLQTLLDGNKQKVMLIYTDVVKEACAFYAGLCPTNTAAAKKSLANIGKTLVEKFPVLCVSDYQQPWTYFNEKLSSALRNTRSRLKRKLSGPKTCHKLLRAIPPVAEELSEGVYQTCVAELKKEAAKPKPDISHMKVLINRTYARRRAWIDSTPSTELSLAAVLGEYPCFTMPEMLLEEFHLMKGCSTVDSFPGIIHFDLHSTLLLDLLSVCQKQKNASLLSLDKIWRFLCDDNLLGVSTKRWSLLVDLHPKFSLNWFP